MDKIIVKCTKRYGCDKEKRNTKNMFGKFFIWEKRMKNVKHCHMYLWKRYKQKTIFHYYFYLYKHTTLFERIVNFIYMEINISTNPKYLGSKRITMITRRNKFICIKATF